MEVLESVVEPVADPSGRPAETPPEKPDLIALKGIPAMSRGAQWLFENRRLDMKPYLHVGEDGPRFCAVDSLESLYPGVAPKIIKARNAGYSENQIMLNIEDMVERALDGGYTDAMIERNLYYGYKDYGFFEKPFGSFFYGRPRNILEKMWDYLGTTPDYGKSPMRHEIRAVAERGLSALTLGFSDAIQEEVAIPASIPGTIAGSAAELVGFIYGPMKASKYLIGGRLAPTATGLRGVTQICTEGGATLGLAGFLSSAIPAFTENENLTDATVEVVESTVTMGIIGMIYPLAGAIENKPLRLAVGMAVMDVIRGRGGFTIDDVAKGIADGTIDRQELAERSFGYLLDLYFLNRVSSMRKQLKGLEENAMIRRMLKVQAEEAEKMLVELGKAGMTVPDDPKFFDGVGKMEKVKAFGAEKHFDAAYRTVQGEQLRLAEHIRRTIAEKVRIPKELQPLAEKSLTFTKAKNFAGAFRNKVKDVQKKPLQETFGGDLIKLWDTAHRQQAQIKYALTLSGSEAAKLLNGMSVEKMYNQTDAELQRLSDGKIKKAYQGAARALWDTSANIKSKLLKDTGALGKEAVIRHDLIRGSSSKADRMVNTASLKIYGGLTKPEQVTLDRIIQSRRTIAIERYKPGMKHPAGLGMKEHQAYLDSIPKKTFAKLSERANLYFKEMDSQLKQLRDAGIITKESYVALLQTGDYSPRRFIQYIDTERTYTFGGKKISVWDSGIKALDEGSYKVMETNSRALLAQVVTRTQARIFRNEANRALYELAKQQPDNKVVKLSKIVKTTKEGRPVFQKPLAGYERLGVMIDGQMREMLMPENLTKEWVSSDPAISSQAANIMGWVSGAKILRPMATGINPEFAVANLPRDIAHAWITTYEYSPHLPIAAKQMAKDYKAVFKDTIFRRGAWLDYINEGGGMSFLTHQGRITKKTTGPLRGLQDVLGYIGETSEIWTRLALRERAIRNGKPPHEATWIARNYIDFSQGGSFTKGADAAVPYLNAGVQGTRGIFRAAKERPFEFTYKVAEIGTLATGLYLANRYTNPECWESISDHDKVNYFCITTPLSYIDEEGNKRHLYFKVAKDQGQKLTCTLFENMMARYLGDDIDVDQITQAAREIIRLAPVDLLPPAFDATLGYYANEDFWRNKDIWRGPAILPEQEYRPYTHPALVRLGEVTGMSPERTRYALQQYFTYNNVYTTAVGGGLRLIMEPLPEDVKDSTVNNMLQQAPFLRRVLKSTDPYTQYAKEIKEVKIEEATRRYKQTRTLDAISEQFYAGQIDQDQVRTFIGQQPWQDRERLLARHQEYGRLYEIPDRRWWLNLMGLEPETAATAYWTRYQAADREEQKRLEKNLRQVPSVISERFMLRLNQLKAKK